MGPDMKEDKFQEIKRYLQSQKEQQYFNKWLENQKQKAKIEVYLKIDEKESS